MSKPPWSAVQHCQVLTQTEWPGNLWVFPVALLKVEATFSFLQHLAVLLWFMSYQMGIMHKHSSIPSTNSSPVTIPTGFGNLNLIKVHKNYWIMVVSKTWILSLHLSFQNLAYLFTSKNYWNLISVKINVIYKVIRLTLHLNLFFQKTLQLTSFEQNRIE